MLKKGLSAFYGNKYKIIAVQKPLNSVLLAPAQQTGVSTTKDREQLKQKGATTQK